MLHEPTGDLYITPPGASGKDGNMTQKQMILQHMKETGSITPGTALEEYGCFRLAARIADLKADGYNIKTYRVSTLNKFGEKVRFAKYVLEETA